MAHYDAQFRSLVVKKVQSGMSISEASRLFECARDTIRQWLKWAEDNALKRSKPKRRKSRKFTDEQLESFIESNNDSTLHEISEHFNCSHVAVWNRLKKLDITRKKKLHSTANATKKIATNGA